MSTQSFGKDPLQAGKANLLDNPVPRLGSRTFAGLFAEVFAQLMIGTL